MRSLNRKRAKGDICIFMCDDKKFTDLNECKSYAKFYNINIINVIIIDHIYPLCISCNKPNKVGCHSIYCKITYPLCKSCGEPSRKNCHKLDCKLAYPICSECNIKIYQSKHLSNCSLAHKLKK